MKRTETREMLFKALYEIEIQKDVSEEHTDLFLENNEITDNEAISYIKKAIKEITERKDELEELKRAREMPIVFDEDCPETTPERAMRFRRVNPPRGTGVRRA